LAAALGAYLVSLSSVGYQAIPFRDQ